jgi:MFS family permease
MTSVGQRAQKSSMEDESTARTEDFQSQNITDHHDKLRSRLHGRLKKTFRLKSSFSATFRSAPFQLSLIAFISFLCPGMYNALNGLGGSGLIQADPANKANVALYSTFSVAGFFAGIVTNKLGVKIALGIGGLGYALYASSFLCYKHTGNSGFLLFAGAQLGICAGVFWAAQSMTAIAYPTERSTGRSISWFWVVYNLGAVLGSMVSNCLETKLKCN